MLDAIKKNKDQKLNRLRASLTKQAEYASSSDRLDTYSCRDYCHFKRSTWKSKFENKLLYNIHKAKQSFENHP